MNRQLKSLVREFEKFGTSTLSDALDRLGINGIIIGFHAVSTQNVVGPVTTVKEISNKFGESSLDEFRIGDVIDKARPGEVIVFDNSGAEVSTWGSLATYSARMKGVKGVIVYGSVRDSAEISKATFPVFAKSTVPTSGKGRIRIESIDAPLEIQGVRVMPGDVAVCDADGIAIIPRGDCERVLKEAKRLEHLEREILSGMKRGKSLGELAKNLGHV